MAGPPSRIQYQGHFLQTYVATKKSPTPTVKRAAPVAPVIAPVRPSKSQPKEEVVTAIKPPSRPISRKPVTTTPMEPEDTFPKLEKAIYPIGKSPNWGAMRNASEWDRIYPELSPTDFVEIPSYTLSDLTIPLGILTQDLHQANIALITAKLFYSTRFFGKYHIDSGEFEGRHPGIDFKLAAGTPVWSIAGGKVHATGTDDMLGNFVMIEHRLPSGEAVISIYGHLERIDTAEGQTVKPGTPIGIVGSTGASSGPHLHLQIDKKKSPGRHSVYAPDSVVSADVASQWTLHPIEFIQKW